MEKIISTKTWNRLKDKCNKVALRRFLENHVLKKRRERYEEPDKFDRRRNERHWIEQKLENFGGISCNEEKFEFMGARLSRGIFADVFHGYHKAVKG